LILQDVCVAAPEARDLFAQALASIRHELVFASAPQLVAMSNRVWHMSARCLDYMLTHRSRVEWQRLAAPVDGFPFGRVGSIHILMRQPAVTPGARAIPLAAGPRWRLH